MARVVQPRATKKFKPTKRRRGISEGILRCAAKIWRNLIYFLYCLLAIGFAYQAVFSGYDRDLWISWGIAAVALMVLQWTGMMLLGYLFEAGRRDRAVYERQYWIDNQANNEAYRQESEAQMRRQQAARTKSKFSSRRNRGISLDKSDSSSLDHSGFLIRGEIKGEAPKGVSEAGLAELLARYFGSCQIHEEYFKIEGTELGYTTDFSIIESVTGIGIDLEVDEPYEGKTKKPHHCTDVKSDGVRNIFFVERGWIVLRVSEYQVVNQPLSVCKLVGQILYRFTGEESYILPLEQEPNLTVDPMWNSIGVRQMVGAKYREKYLDKAGIFAYDPVREARNRQAYLNSLKQQRKDALKQKRKNLKNWKNKKRGSDEN